MNDISGPAEVCDHRDGATSQSFEDYACTIVANRWKYKHIGSSQAAEDICVAEPAAKRDRIPDSKRSRKLLEALPLRAIAKDDEAGQIVSQEGSSRAQREITCLAGDQPADKD